MVRAGLSEKVTCKPHLSDRTKPGKRTRIPCREHSMLGEQGVTGYGEEGQGAGWGHRQEGTSHTGSPELLHSSPKSLRVPGHSAGGIKVSAQTPLTCDSSAHSQRGGR